MSCSFKYCLAVSKNMQFSVDSEIPLVSVRRLLSLGEATDIMIPYLMKYPQSHWDIFGADPHGYGIRFSDRVTVHTGDRAVLQHLVRCIGNTTYDVIHVPNSDLQMLLYARFLSHTRTVFLDVSDRGFYQRVFRKSRIAMISLHVGEEFREITQYSLVSKIEYCLRHHYDLICDESAWDTSRPAAWSKIKILQKYLADYDWVVWVDADTLIMNPAITLEELMQSHNPHNVDMLVGHDSMRINTGVWFLYNTSWSHTFLQHVWEQEQFIDSGYWEQEAFIFLLDNNDMDAKQHVTSVFHTAFNSYYYNFKWGHFLLHFPGCRPLAKLQLAMNNYCIVQKFDETKENYQRRLHWIEHCAEAYEASKR